MNWILSLYQIVHGKKWSVALTGIILVALREWRVHPRGLPKMASPEHLWIARLDGQRSPD
jgi:hypothetical protein